MSWFRIDGIARRRAALRLSLLSLLSVFAACGGSEPGTTTPPPPPPPSPPTVASVLITPDAATLSVGETRQLAATARTASGLAIDGKTFAWSTSAAAVATVSPSGLVTAIAPGAVTVTASVDNVVASATLTVSQTPVVSLSANGAMTLVPGHVLQLTAVARADNGAVLSGRTIGWSSSSPAIVSTSATGVVTAHAAGTATITASVEGRTTNVPITVLDPPTGPSDSQLREPRVFDLAAPDSILLTSFFTAPRSRVELVTLSGATIPLRQLSPTRWTIRIAPSLVSSSYQLNQTAWIGYVDAYGNDGVRVRSNLVIPVRTAAMPAVTATVRSAVAQQTSHVLNLRYDTLMSGQGLSSGNIGFEGSSLARRAYALLGDDYDFLFAVENVETFANRYYVGLRNDEARIGLSLRPLPNGWGSAGRLRGYAAIPSFQFFDAAERGQVHEIGHQWLAFVPGIANTPHWAPGDLGVGIMGVSTLGGQGLNWSSRVEQTSATTYAWRCVTGPIDFNAMELYLMGILPRDSVTRTFLQPAAFSANSAPVCDSPVVGSVRHLTVDSVATALGGVRTPAAQRDFRAATIVFSLGRLLSPSELAWVNEMAARGEAERELRTNAGIALDQIARPWFMATGGRSRMRMRL